MDGDHLSVYWIRQGEVACTLLLLVARLDGANRLCERYNLSSPWQEYWMLCRVQTSGVCFLSFFGVLAPSAPMHIIGEVDDAHGARDNLRTHAQ